MQEKSRILLYTTAFRPLVGGSEIALEEISRRLPEFDFDIVTGQPLGVPAQERDQNITIYRTGRMEDNFFLPKITLPLYLFWKGLRLMAKHDYTAIHAYQASQAAGAAWLLKLWHPEIPFIVTLQEGKEFQSQSFLVNFFRSLILRQADIITVISGYLEDKARSINPHAEIVRIANGVDPNIFKPRDGGPVRASLGIPESARIIISVSRLVHKNGLSDLIKAFRKVHASHSNTRLVLVGTGPLESQLRELAGDAPITFAGAVAYAKLPEYLSMADVFVRPSLSEGLGTAFLEAMACQVPVIGSRVGGIPDIINSETGLLVKPGDVDGIAQAVGHMLTDPTFRESCALAGRRLVESAYTWDQAADKFRNLYGNL